MPYFIYQIGPVSTLHKLGHADSFKEAKNLINDLRKKLVPENGRQIKMIFAENELQAEDTLLQPRELDPSLAGDDY